MGHEHFKGGSSIVQWVTACTVFVKAFPAPAAKVLAEYYAANL